MCTVYQAMRSVLRWQKILGTKTDSKWKLLLDCYAGIILKDEKNECMKYKKTNRSVLVPVSLLVNQQLLAQSVLRKWQALLILH